MRIGIIGHFGGNKTFTDGQTVKIINLYEGLKRKTNIKIDKIDTYYYKRNNLKLFFLMLKCIFLDKKIIFLPASRGRKILMKIMYFFAKFFRKHIYHSCIGGGLVRDVSKNPIWVKYLNSYKANWMESQFLCDGLQKLGVNNATYLPNFKHINPSTIAFVDSRPVKFCTFSRVSEMKGIDEAVDAIERINDMYGPKTAILDIYGPVQEGEEEWFDQLSKKLGTNCFYKGCVDPSRSVSVLENYHALLFPTRYVTEGMPGTIIDAMFAGVPVISRKWASCDQMIENGKNGIVYEFEKPELLFSCVKNFIDNLPFYIEMRNRCKEESIKYSEDNVISTILQTMELNRYDG